MLLNAIVFPSACTQSFPEPLLGAVCREMRCFKCSRGASRPFYRLDASETPRRGWGMRLLLRERSCDGLSRVTRSMRKAERVTLRAQRVVTACCR